MVGPMCGIAGLVAYGGSVIEASSIVAAMTERIHHRGPDGGGIAAHEDATLGMKRLAIVDVAHGHQPMKSDDGDIVLVFNGEIYNAPELRKTLIERGVRFHTRSDTEVILRLYEAQPERVEEELRGMWAFAIHDKRRRRVVLSRDRFGIKPLFVADTGKALAFGSELRCFDRSLGPFSSCFAIDHAAAHAMLSWSYVPEDATIWSGVRRLSPATRLEIDLASGKRTSRVFWTLTPSADAARITNLAEACTHVEDALRTSVREHLESDLPIATFLSGGIDSSLVTAYARDASPSPLRAFSIGFREPRFDESPYARQAAHQLGIPIDVAMLDEDTARRHVTSALLAYDEPFGDSSSVATLMLAAHVAKSHKVALGGDGGDEAFAGYKKYLILRIRRPFAFAPAVRNNLGRALKKIPVRTDRTRAWTETLRTLRRVARGLEGEAVDIQVELAQVAPLARTAPLMRHPASALEFVDAARRRYADATGTELQRMLACELGNALVNDMLVKVDRASMAHHLEVRVPFLDHRVVELGVGLPEAFTLGTNGKLVLRTLHEKKFGAELAHRKKQGFGVPVEKWLRGPLAAACEQLFDSKRLERYDVLSADELGDGRFRVWAERDPVVLWHAFALAAWCEATLGDGAEGLRDVLSASSRRSA